MIHNALRMRNKLSIL